MSVGKAGFLLGAFGDPETSLEGGRIGHGATHSALFIVLKKWSVAPKLITGKRYAFMRFRRWYDLVRLNSLQLSAIS